MWWSERPILFVAVMLAALSGGCGFQVRGATQYPEGMEVVYVDSDDRYSPFYRELTSTFRQGGLMLTPDATKADTIFRVSQDQSGRRVLSVSARNVPVEYEVYYTIRYSVTINGEERLAVQQLTLTRNYTYNDTEVLGKSIEESVLRDALAAELVGRVTRRIGSLD